MKLGFVNKGQEFNLPDKIITVRDDKEILDYMSKLDKDMPQTVKTLNEFTETIYRVLLKIDKTITRETIEDNLTTEEIGILYGVFRSKDNLVFICPGCGKQHPYSALFTRQEKQDVAGDKNFHQLKTTGGGITEMKETVS